MPLPLRKLSPLVIRARGVSDAVDGTNAFPGAMTQLVNLLHNPSTTDTFVPRPASILQNAFGSFTTPTGITAMLVLGNLVYGMISSAAFAGKDQPFVYNIITNTFETISGVIAGVLPATQPTSGAWTPPVISAVSPSKILVTHPGFAGGVSPFFGWFDISSFSLATLTGNVTNGSSVIQSVKDGSTDGIIADGVAPGQLITAGALFPAGTTVVSVTNGTFSLNTTGNTNATTTLAAVGSLTGVQVGMMVTGSQFTAGTYVSALPGGGNVTLSVAALGTLVGATVNFSGGATITVSNNATGATTALQSLSITGGTPAAPLWGAGNTNTVPLASVPTAVSLFNGRAYFATGPYLVGSDVLNPTQVSFASQILTIGDNTPITALSPLPLTSTVTGGVIQSLIVFKGASGVTQVTGDFATNNIAQATLPGAVGTLAPRTICGTPEGLAYVSPDGLRLLTFSGQITEVIGGYGHGVSMPFINTDVPSRMCAAFGQSCIRISVHNIIAANQPWQEWVYNTTHKAWTGPHSFPSSAIASYTAGAMPGFIHVNQASPVGLWFSTLMPLATSTYTENSLALTWVWQTVLMPDNGGLSVSKVDAATMGLALNNNQNVTVSAFDDRSLLLDNVQFGPPAAPAASVWGSVNWGAFAWGAAQAAFKQYRIAWNNPLVFKQASVALAGSSQAGNVIGNMYVGLQALDYMLEDQGL